MARMDTDGLDDMIREMQRMGQDTGEVADVLVTAAVQEISAAWKESAEAHGLIDTGAMLESIGTRRSTPARGPTATSTPREKTEKARATPRRRSC